MQPKPAKLVWLSLAVFLLTAISFIYLYSTSTSGKDLHNFTTVLRNTSLASILLHRANTPTSKDVKISKKGGLRVSDDSQQQQQLGYVIPLSFNEQLESGMYDLFQLIDMAHSWGMKVGEPFMQGSHFNFPSSPNQNTLTHYLKLSGLQHSAEE